MSYKLFINQNYNNILLLSINKNNFLPQFLYQIYLLI